MNRMQYVGFWSDSKETATVERPWPEGRPYGHIPDVGFLKKLKKVEEIADVKHFRGRSTCRICWDMNGSKEYHTDSWTWPEGYAHYVEKHNIEVPSNFVDYIKAFPLETEYKASVKRTLEKVRDYTDSIPTALVDDVTVNCYTRKMQKKAQKMLTTVLQYLDFMETMGRPRADPDELEACSDSIKQVVDTFCEMASTQITKHRNKRVKTEE